jgi:DNA-directed RNA polymerase beta' subunit
MEMNFHIPQSIQTHEELKQITMVPTQIISPGTSKPCMKIMVDTLIGSYLLTQPDIKLSKQKFQNLLTFSKYYNGKIPEPAGYDGDVPYWIGRQLISMILPDISITHLKDAKIIRGEMVDGYLSGESLGNKPTGIIQQIYNVYGTEQMTRFMNDVEKVVTRWLVGNCFSIGFGDAVIKKSDRKEVNNIIEKEIQNAYDIIIRAQQGVYALELDDSLRADKLEADMNAALSGVTEKVKKYITQIINKKNGFKEAIDSGATKGDMGHITNITALVGKFDIWGKRIPNEFTHRTLPHFAKYDLSPEAKGYSKDSLILGMNPANCFFGAMNGRNGKIDTAIKSVTGDTPIIILDNGFTRHVNIGDWIDELLDEDASNIQIDTDEGEHREMLKIGKYVYIPTTDLDGKVQWGEITHITRHNPSAVMYEVKTSGGRNVVVTDSHSLLVWNEETEQFERKSASNVHVGNHVPVSYHVPDYHETVLYEYDLKKPFFDIEQRDMAMLSLNMQNIYVEIDTENPLKLKYGKHYTVHNDVVLDRIVEINPVDSSKYSKVYDLTVPSTLNFGLANGLHVVDTADSGYTSRKFVKATEDLVVAYDLTVRNAANVIVQFIYGDDNMDPSKIEKITKIDIIEYDNQQMKKYYLYDDLLDKDYFETFMNAEAVEEMMKDAGYVQKLKDEYETMVEYRDMVRHNFFKNVEMIGDIGTYISINPQRLIQSSLVRFGIEKFHVSDLTPQYVIEKFDEMIQSIVQYFPEKEDSIMLQRILLKSYLASKRVIGEYRMNRFMYDYILEMIHMKMMNSIITPGETVGVIAAQTLGEGTTQMTLNTFHSISSAASVVTEGLPRLNEIIKLTKNMKHKNMKIYLKDEYKTIKDEAKKVKTRFAYTKLKDLLSESEIIYMGEESYTDTDEEREFIRSYQDFCKIFDIEQCEEEELSPWMIRFVFDKEAMMNRNISVIEIQEKIKEKESDDIQCLFSDDSASNVVMRVRFVKDNSGNFLQFMRDVEKQLSEMTIRGIDGIELADLVEKSCMKYNADGSYEASKEWTISTKGSNIIDIMSDDAVDYTKTTTNDIMDFVEIFGIEAVRNLLVIEFGIVYQSNGINVRHIDLMADVMSYRGKLMQIDRHGTNKNPDIGPIGKASFEAVMDVFTKAALFAEKDNMKGTSSNIFAGQFCKAGTNAFEIVMDEEKLMKPVPVNENYKPAEMKKEFTEDEIDDMMDSMYAERKPEDEIQDDDFDFGFGLEKAKQTLLTGPSITQVHVHDKKTGTTQHIAVENKDMSEETLQVPMYNMDEKNKKENKNLQVPMIEETEDEEEKMLFVPTYESEKEEEVPVKKKRTKKILDNKQNNKK